MVVKNTYEKAWQKHNQNLFRYCVTLLLTAASIQISSASSYQQVTTTSLSSQSEWYILHVQNIEK